MPAAYRLLGINDDTDTCEVCGKTELRSVMALQPLDEDGTADGDALYAGTTCGARALTRTLGRRVTARRLTDASIAINTVLREARRWAVEFVDITEARYINANSVALMNANNHDVTAAVAAGKRHWVEVRAEAAQLVDAVSGADLIGTRFEALLPKI